MTNYEHENQHPEFNVDTDALPCMHGCGLRFGNTSARTWHEVRDCDRRPVQPPEVVE